MKKCAIVTGTLSLLYGASTHKQIPHYSLEKKFSKRRIANAATQHSNKFSSDELLLKESTCIDKNTTICAELKIWKDCEESSIAAICPKTCRLCCVDDESFTFPQEGGNEILKKCSYIKTGRMRKKYCKGKTNTKCALSCRKKKCLTPESTGLLTMTKNLILPPSEELKSVRSLSTSSKDLCPNGKTSFQIVLRTDSYPSETTWYLNKTRSTFLLSGGPYTSPNSPHIDTHCVDNDECYEFTILDGSGNGLCCYNGDTKARYQVYFGGNLVQEGGSFKSSETSPSFGTCSPSNIPSDIG